MAEIFKIYDGYIAPATASLQDIGSVALPFKDGHFSGNLKVAGDIDAASFDCMLTLNGDVLTLNGDVLTI